MREAAVHLRHSGTLGIDWFLPRASDELQMLQGQYHYLIPQLLFIRFTSALLVQ